MAVINEITERRRPQKCNLAVTASQKGIQEDNYA
jgi:hypothetical protein